ncbi:hypothetical protein NESM_000271400 [Novymonas esmeraldas]|uniref:Uncharacterized protein n=1 Tax=Novymonas esmeraldas TaxID=1808958 RepID=A0AAW0F615_9TRYP
MTEFKKLTTLTQDLAQDVSALNLFCAPGTCSSSNGSGPQEWRFDSTKVDAEVMNQLASRIREAVTDGMPRLRKLVLKARETDPNRQIYNETMCARINALFVAFGEALQLLSPDFVGSLPSAMAPPPEGELKSNVFDSLLDAAFDPSTLLEESAALQTSDDVYNRYILERAKVEAWQSRVAQGLADVVAFQSQNRAVILADERVRRAALTEEKRADRLRVMRVLEERAEAKWQSELLRRREELSHFSAAAADLRDVGAIPAFLASAIPDERVRGDVADRTRQLIKALLSTPEDIIIRRLRNNNERLLCDYGHPCLTARERETGEECACRSVVRAAEALWCRMGYTIRYTKVPNRSLEVVRCESKAHSLVLPCGHSLTSHAYEPMGFEDYSERLLELAEPDAMERADEWMEWYTMMQHMEATLAGMARKTRR